MKVVEKNLYIRNGYYYYRSILPRFLQKVVKKREVVLSLASQDLSQSRLEVAKINYKLSNLYRSTDWNKGDDSIYDVLRSIQDIKSSTGYQNPQLGSTKLMTFSEVAKLYLNETRQDAQCTRYHKKKAYTLFEELIGDIHFYEIDKSHARHFKACILKIPSNAKKVTGIKSFKGVDLDKLKKKGKPQSPITINNTLTYMGTLFKWAYASGYTKIENPFVGLKIKGGKKLSNVRECFSDNDIKGFFHSPIYTGSKGKVGIQRLIKGEKIIADSLYWVPLIALYSGMRMNEICQLDIDDIKEEGGVWYFDINEKEGKKLKTVTSERKVPVHNHLIEKGLVKYLNDMQAQGSQRLFPDINKGASGTYSGTFTKRFARVLNQLELKREGLCFHSFRHTFIDGMRNAGVERSIIMALTGHQSGAVHEQYGRGYNINILNKALNKLSFLVLED